MLDQQLFAGRKRIKPSQFRLCVFNTTNKAFWNILVQVKFNSSQKPSLILDNNGGCFLKGWIHLN